MKGRAILTGSSGRKATKQYIFVQPARDDTPAMKERHSFRLPLSLNKEMWADYYVFKAAFMLHEWRVKWGLLDPSGIRKATP